MSLLNKIGGKIAQTSQSAAQKTKNTAETIKLKSMISDEEKSINNSYEQIGKLYFQAFGANPEEPFSELITYVKNSIEKIAGYEEQINQLRGIVICQDCNGEVADDMRFCGCCGSPVNTVPIEPASDESLCIKCGFTFSSDSLFCTNCGNNVEPPAEIDPAE